MEQTAVDRDRCDHVAATPGRLALGGRYMRRLAKAGQAIHPQPSLQNDAGSMPPSPPSGPPRGTYFSRRRLEQPSPPLPACNSIWTRSTNILPGMQVGGKRKPNRMQQERRTPSPSGAALPSPGQPPNAVCPLLAPGHRPSEPQRLAPTRNGQPEFGPGSPMCPNRRDGKLHACLQSLPEQPTIIKPLVRPYCFRM